MRKLPYLVIGSKYERNEVKPSVEVAVKIADALEVSLDYLAGNTDLLLEKNVVNKIIDIQKLDAEDKAHVFAMLDASLRDHKTKKAYTN
ncbi:helix-turn-helix domain-containing protein [Niabella ginsenosidivorans]|uniref:helix-turn-helix domain-containing protein n=1 Tax=Niabella ginsenosidivorans TaxID=1176587 RepID=UPI001FDF8230|nr:helix-turn-helix transcriptional regulator [Niabella ginsenosidivorans]